MLNWRSLIAQTSAYAAESALTSIYHISSCELCEAADCIKKQSVVLHAGHISDDRAMCCVNIAIISTKFICEDEDEDEEVSIEWLWSAQICFVGMKWKAVLFYSYTDCTVCRPLGPQRLRSGADTFFFPSVNSNSTQNYCWKQQSEDKVGTSLYSKKRVVWYFLLLFCLFIYLLGGGGCQTLESVSQYTIFLLFLHSLKEYKIT